MNSITSRKEKVNVETIKNDKIVKLQWVLRLGPKLRNEFQKFDIKPIFTSGRDLKNLFCRNKSKLLPNSSPGVFQSMRLYLQCPIYWRNQKEGHH